MNLLRHILAITLSLALGLAPVAAAEMRGPLSGVQSVTLCSGDGAKVISLDSDGNPVEVAHVCLDCCLVVSDLPQATALPKPLRLVRFSAVLTPKTRILPRPMAVKPWTRGPPLSV